jgi:hypothetical protein
MNFIENVNLVDNVHNFVLLNLVYYKCKSIGLALQSARKFGASRRKNTLLSMENI